ncbi:MAG: hypothetical protein U5R30_00165 [Deltaproteobacteria bacterium]|nr:hypothetical protein [Deltaproteobacteria bacterium]
MPDREPTYSDGNAADPVPERDKKTDRDIEALRNDVEKFEK